jgi:hypothetical protein
VCGDDDDAKTVIGGLIEDIPDLRWIDCGALSMARITETLTPLLINVNRRYKIKDSGFRIVGRGGVGLAAVTDEGGLVRIDDTALWVVERGEGYPVIVLHGGPGLDHHEFRRLPRSAHRAWLPAPARRPPRLRPLRGASRTFPGPWNGTPRT